MKNNPLGIDGIEFIEFASPVAEQLKHLFFEFGFSRTHEQPKGKIDLFQQNDIYFLLNHQPFTHASEFCGRHGPSIPSMGWRVKDARHAYVEALKRGAKPAETSDYCAQDGTAVPAIQGVGGSLIYFVETKAPRDWIERLGFKPLTHPQYVSPRGFIAIDHLTNNVEKGTLKRWADFYKEIFNFSEVRYFDIHGVKTGLQSYALRSPCGKFCIPINEANEEKSQINEYIREYRGPGIQHLAFLTENLIASLEAMKGTAIETLDIEPNYYDEVFERVKQVSEDHEKIRELQILVDGDDKGYLLQIFTKNLIGPIFIEMIQRKNHLSFGEGNFGALFRSIERDQERRGVFQT